MLNEHLEHLINQKLINNGDLSSQRIEVIANDGVVTLRGEVQSYRRKLAAHEIASSDNQVAEVCNEIIVTSPDIENDLSITGQINDLLDAAPDLSNASICVSTNSQDVSLTGYVKTELEKKRAADNASAVNGVRRVTNLLVVNPDEVASNRDHCNTILKAIHENIGMERQGIRLAVVNEAARLSGSVDATWKRELAEAIVRQFGILTVSNEMTIQK